MQGLGHEIAQCSNQSWLVAEFEFVNPHRGKIFVECIFRIFLQILFTSALFACYLAL